MTCATLGVLIGQLDVMVVARYFDYASTKEYPDATKALRRPTDADFGYNWHFLALS
jgi:hypothetical protein